MSTPTQIVLIRACLCGRGTCADFRSYAKFHGPYFCMSCCNLTLGFRVAQQIVWVKDSLGGASTK